VAHYFPYKSIFKINFFSGIDYQRIREDCTDCKGLKGLNNLLLFKSNHLFLKNQTIAVN